MTINYTFGENGLITKAQQAKEQTEITSIIERMELAEGSAYIDGRGTIYPDNYFDILESAIGLENLQTIGGDAYFRLLKSAEGLENLRIVNGKDATEFKNEINSRGNIRR